MASRRLFDGAQAELDLLPIVAAASAGVTGTLAATETGADVFAATGGSVATITGTLAATETGSDTLAATGTVLVEGALAATETGSDVFAATGGTVTTVTGSLAATETGSDVLAASGVVVVAGTMAATETGSDVFAATGDTLFFTITGSQARRLLAIHLLHGLEIGSPLTVSATARQAGVVTQTVADAAGTVTVATTAGVSVFAGDPGLMIDELAALHGITAPLVVTASSRVAGSIVQSIGQAGDVTTVSRAA